MSINQVTPVQRTVAITKLRSLGMSDTETGYVTSSPTTLYRLVNFIERGGEIRASKNITTSKYNAPYATKTVGEIIIGKP